MKNIVTFVLLSTFLTCSAYAQNDSERNFAGLKFGVGISLTADLDNNARIGSANIVNGLVRVTDENNATARIMLESHYFFTPTFAFPFNVKLQGDWGLGPFVALQPGSDEIIEAVGLGLMIGFKRASNDENDTSSWNFGIGIVVDPNVQTLGDGLSANNALPMGETEIRFREEAQSGLLFITSFSF